MNPALIGLAKLMRMAFSGQDLTPLGEELITRSQNDPSDANALMDLSTVLQLKGEHDIAMEVQMQALSVSPVYHIPGEKSAIRLLAIMGPGDLMANTPVEFLLENSDVSLDIFYVSPNIPLPETLPEHDVVFVCIGYCDENLPLLKEIAGIVEFWPRPVLNNPSKIARLSRDNVCQMLKDAPGAAMPASVRIERSSLESIGLGSLLLNRFLEGGDFPVILRPVDSHAGKGLDKVDDTQGILDYLRGRPEKEFYISRFVDYRSADGFFRKYRIVLIEGIPYVCHMAISQNWMIHYLNAGMTESAGKRAEEARFMASFDQDFAVRHREAFRAIHERAGLDYLGIDCGETKDGELLIFEIDSNMIVHAIDPVDLFPYKQIQMQAVFSAFRQMLAKAVEHSK